jgi:hypothetical protein
MDTCVLTLASSERRLAARRAPAPDEPIARARLRAGRELTVVDLSNGGVLVEGTARLLPGTHVDVHIVTKDGRTLVRSRVARAYVYHLDAQIVRYRGALAFDRAIDTSAAEYAAPAMLVFTERSPDPAVANSVAESEG